MEKKKIMYQKRSQICFGTFYFAGQCFGLSEKIDAKWNICGVTLTFECYLKWRLLQK